MNPNPDTDDVSPALSLLRDSLSEEEQRIRGEGVQAMRGGEYDTATSVIDLGSVVFKEPAKINKPNHG